MVMNSEIIQSETVYVSGYSAPQYIGPAFFEVVLGPNDTAEFMKHLKESFNQQAEQAGGNAVVGIHTHATRVGGSSVKYFAYGTVAQIQPLPRLAA